MGDFVDDLNSLFLGQHGDVFVSAPAVRLCVVLIGQLCDIPLCEQFGENFFWLSSDDKQSNRSKDNTKRV